MKKYIRLIVINTLVMIGLLLLVELILMGLGYQCGFDTNRQFKKVDEIVELKGYTTDEVGIMKVDEGARSYVSNYISNGILGNKIKESYSLYKKDVHFTPYSIGRDYLKIKNREWENDFSEYLLKIKQSDLITDYEKELIHYSKNPINKEGFRGISFKYFDSHRIKVLLLQQFSL